MASSFMDKVARADKKGIERVGDPAVIRKPKDGRRYECNVLIERSIEFTDDNGAIKRRDLATFLNADWPYVDEGDELMVGPEHWTVHTEISNDSSMTTVFLR